MATHKYLFSFFMLIFFAWVSHAQEDIKVVSLKKILNQIAVQHDVRFSFIEDDIVAYSLVPPKADATLKEKISYLKANTRLQFKAVSVKYFTVFKDSQMDKPLCAFLIDALTGIPIENATIDIENTNAAATSDVYGYFEFPVISSNNIRIRHMGYEIMTIRPEVLYTSSCPKLYLKPMLEALDEVTTQRFLTTGITKNIDGGYEVKPRKFGILPGLTTPDVLQTMQQLPGITSNDETVSNINVRGGTHDQNLFLWNGIRMFQTGHFFGLISSFNPSLAQNIAISKNGSSAFYGESVSSIVDISSRSKNVEASRNSISVNMISAEFFSKVKLNETGSLEVSGRRSLTDFFISPTYEKYRDRIFQNTVVTNTNDNQTTLYNSNENFYFYDLSAQFQQKLGRHEFSLDLIKIQNSLDIDQSSENELRQSHLGQQNLGGNISWESKWSSRNTSKFHFYTSYYNLDARNESMQNNQILAQGNKVLDWGFELRDSHKVWETLTIAAGYQFDEIGVENLDQINNPSFSRNVTEVLLTHALIVESTFETMDKKTFLRAGVRGNYFTKFNIYIAEPRLQFSQSLSKSVRMEILGEQKSQSLSQIIDLQDDFLGIEKRRWTLANEDNIPIQKSSQLSLGFSFKKKNWLISIDNFYKKVVGITSSAQGFQNQFEYIRAIGNYTTIGSELFIQKNFKRFYTWMCYSYNDNQYTFEQFSASAFSNNFELPHTFSWAGIYEWRKLKVALGSNWHTGRPITTPASNTVDNSDPGNPMIVYNAPNNDNLKDYFRLNFSATREWDLSRKVKLQTSFAILNLLNNTNVVNKFYRVNTNDNSIESVSTYSLELTPDINLKLTF